MTVSPGFHLGELGQDGVYAAAGRSVQSKAGDFQLRWVALLKETFCRKGYSAEIFD
jgi:hypothetical protein